jgi:hypothetical protein
VHAGKIYVACKYPRAVIDNDMSGKYESVADRCMCVEMRAGVSLRAHARASTCVCVCVCVCMCTPVCAYACLCYVVCVS